MPKYTAFLRAINVGGHVVKMDLLRKLFEEMGFANVETFIASGNVIFEADTKDRKLMEHRIADTLREALGYGVATFIRSMDELAEIARYRPFPEAEMEAENNVIQVAFLNDTPGDETGHKLQSFRTVFDEFHVSDSEVYWLSRRRSSESDFSGAVLEKALGMPATLRNIRTVRKITAKY